MPKVEESRYDLTSKKKVTDSYQGRILSRSLSNRILRSKKATDFLVYIEDILYNWYDSARSIKRNMNFRVGLKDKSIDS